MPGWTLANGRHIYFAYMPHRNAIKIGRSDNPPKRIHNLRQTMDCHTVLLRVVENMGFYETDYHYAWRHLRISGELFHAKRRLLDWVYANGDIDHMEKLDHAMPNWRMQSARLATGLSQKQAGELTGLGWRELINIEYQMYVYSEDIWRKAANAFGLRYDWVVANPKQPKGMKLADWYCYSRYPLRLTPSRNASPLPIPSTAAIATHKPGLEGVYFPPPPDAYEKPENSPLPASHEMSMMIADVEETAVNKSL